jgi:hypothetical protein
MSFRKLVIAAAAFSITALASGSLAKAADADLPVKAAKKVPDLPFFILIDDRVTFSWMPQGTDPGVWSVKPGGVIDPYTAKQVYSFTHFDIWQYGTNFFTISAFKSDHNDPTNPCTNAGVVFNPGTGVGTPADCAGATEFYGLFRSTFSWNDLFGTKMFTQGPLHNISFEVGADIETENNYLAPAKRDVVAGLQFAFDLPYKGFFNVAPLMYWEFYNQDAFVQCGGGFAGPTPYPAPNATCLIDGNRTFEPTWAVEINYYMDLGFLPESINYFSISGRAGWYGTKGTDANPLPVNPANGVNPTAVELNSEPIRLTFDASKAAWGAKWSHYIDVWVAYRYWQNKFGLDHNTAFACTSGVPVGMNNGSCTESTVYTGITLKF